ncbi:Coproporphyrinogen-III oxidase, aerobic [Candidatus Megaera venefica]|uniref:Oxygen-dependent coproporphyrinogen-III oxidase n=1 Tax=Candidatus Megaera venefica TaxID=2055910 RepID=A0ABU5NAQ8_9RICK|nr:oxygen-dependent coproporphyrinogen oxidase [Candidatus Megaera venefica]MEA0970253.1 Coproporphyrinogen-III oxidase, aerobic [Candidatus Megaera venefica]
MEDKRALTATWFKSLRDKICLVFEDIEKEFALNRNNVEASAFERKAWKREGGGGGVMSIMHGNVFEKVGVNISTVHGEFSEHMRKQIPGAEENPQFFATGISLVAHMRSPLVPAVHFNTRYIETTKSWFGGGSDLTPMYEDQAETSKFHQAFKDACDKHNPDYYPIFKKQCDEYFYLKHRNEPRGVGGIFYDYLSNNFNQDFAFTKDVGMTILQTYPEIVKAKMNLDWNAEQRQHQLIKRGRYVEFNLLYDRGTAFGLATNGNVEAILMSLPPEVLWP